MDETTDVIAQKGLLVPAVDHVCGVPLTILETG